jgi:cell division septum initiation protein DivIVA
MIHNPHKAEETLRELIAEVCDEIRFLREKNKELRAQILELQNQLEEQKHELHRIPARKSHK